MFDLNEELILERNELPWLIWVQLLVTILLLFVLFCGFNLFSGDLLSKNPTSSYASSSSLSSSHSGGKNSLVGGSTSLQVGEGSHCIQNDTNASTSKQIVGEESLEREQSSAKDEALLRPFGRAEHPCSYFGFAKQAILKCLGLDSIFDSSCKRSSQGKDD